MSGLGFVAELQSEMAALKETQTRILDLMVQVQTGQEEAASQSRDLFRGLQQAVDQDYHTVGFIRSSTLLNGEGSRGA